MQVDFDIRPFCDICSGLLEYSEKGGQLIQICRRCKNEVVFDRELVLLNDTLVRNSEIGDTSNIELDTIYERIIHECNVCRKETTMSVILGAEDLLKSFVCHECGSIFLPDKIHHPSSEKKPKSEKKDNEEERLASPKGSRVVNRIDCIRDNLILLLTRNGCDERRAVTAVEAATNPFRSEKKKTTITSKVQLESRGIGAKITLYVNLSGSIKAGDITNSLIPENEIVIFVFESAKTHHKNYLNSTWGENAGRLFIFPASFFINDRLSHIYQPECSIVRKENVPKEIEERLGISAEQLPKVLINDPAAMIFLPKLGDVMVYRSASLDAGIEEKFRIVCSPSTKTQLPKSSGKKQGNR